MYCIVPRKLEEDRPYLLWLWGQNLPNVCHTAKMILQNSGAMISIDMPVAPSEVLVTADKYASPVHIAADLLSQLAEHEPDSQVVLVIGGDGIDLRAIEEEIGKQCQDPPRGEFASKARSHSYTVLLVK
ncbi:histidinol dehydrogenase, chloroplastic-like [Mangifera indica]|uniref:histidinol dehydrogenase, chloroplastic-like n=1 Tax=Mangifera indica TaxID=29780 RepID=UPI001CFBED8A|nr:histidinol dehydrogenase, chloroplastic-like [Mangifera indica]